MHNFRTFIFKEYTKDGYPVLGAGIYPYYTNNDIIYLLSSINKFKIDLLDDPFYIDYALASYINKICPNNIYALGLSINLPNISSQTGGIIGNPHNRGSSAEGLSEDIGNGLSVAAYPGGPGVAIYGSAEEAELILKTVKPEEGGKEKLDRMTDKAKELGIDIAIMISDGTGVKSQGCVMTLENNVVKYISIDRW